MKGVSPLIATVLLIAFTVSVAGLLSVWLTGFTRTSTETVESQATISLVCTYGGINLKSLKFNSTSSTLTGSIENTGTIPLGNISVQIIYQNATDQMSRLCLSGGTAVNCSVANLTLSAGGQSSFSISISSNYDKIRTISNCSTVYDQAVRGDVT